MNFSRFKFIIIVILLAISLAGFTFWANLYVGIMALLLALLMIYSHFKQGNIVPALMALRNGNIPAAEQALASIKRPDYLSKRYQGYYYFASGLVDFYHKRIAQGCENLEKALTFGLKNKTELSITHLNIAQGAYMQKDYEKSRKHMELCQAQNPTDLHIKQRLEELAKYLDQNQNQSNS